MKVKQESEKVGLKLNIQKTKIMASSSITSWKIDGKTMKIMTNFFFFLGSKFTVNFDSRHEVKRCLLFGRKAMMKEKKRKRKKERKKKIERKKVKSLSHV